MKISRRLYVSLAMLIADSAWLYVAIALVGFVAARDSAPLSWPRVLLVLTAGAIAEALGRGPRWLAAKILIGAAAIYIAASTLPELGGFEPLWILLLLQGAYPAATMVGLVIALLGAAWLWRQGGLLASEPLLEERTTRRFRTGLTVLALALLFEVAGGARLGIANLLAPFFAASLAGMALARMPDGGRTDLNWVMALSITVVLALALGLAVGAVIGPVGHYGAGALVTGLSYLASLVGEAAGLILFPIMAVIFAVLNWLLDHIAGASLDVKIVLPDWIATPRIDELASWDWPLVVLPYGLALLTAAFLYFVFRPVVRRIRKTAQATGEELHESIPADAAPLADLARLLSLLLGLSTANKGGARHWRYPSGEAGITEAFQLYYYMLQAAIGRQHELRPSATPLERVPSLSAALPGAPVAQITRCFNAACYGRSPAKLETINALRDRLEKAVMSE